jgi:hypothetical protein
MSPAGAWRPPTTAGVRAGFVVDARVADLVAGALAAVLRTAGAVEEFGLLAAFLVGEAVLLTTAFLRVVTREERVAAVDFAVAAAVVRDAAARLVAAVFDAFFVGAVFSLAVFSCAVFGAVFFSAFGFSAVFGAAFFNAAFGAVESLRTDFFSAVLLWAVLVAVAAFLVRDPDPPRPVAAREGAPLLDRAVLDAMIRASLPA